MFRRVVIKTRESKTSKMSKMKAMRVFMRFIKLISIKIIYKRKKNKKKKFKNRNFCKIIKIRMSFEFNLFFALIKYYNFIQLKTLILTII